MATWPTSRASGSDTVVHPKAKRQVAMIGPARDVEPIRVIELGRVAVGRPQEQGDVPIRRDAQPGDLDFREHPAAR